MVSHLPKYYLNYSMFNLLGAHSNGILFKDKSETTEDNVDNKSTESTNSYPSESSSESDKDEYSKYYKKYRDAIYPWESQRFEEHPWSDKKRPFVRMRHFHKLELNEDEKNGILSEKIMSCCLTYLQKSPYDEKYALVKCRLDKKNLTDISAIRKYHYIQYLDVSFNKIKTLSALGEMPYLQYLDASNNSLEDLLDFKAPAFLSYVNYSNNHIKCIPDLSKFWSIVQLDLSYNKIGEIGRGLQSLKYLNYLNLSHNLISKLENVNNLVLDTLLISHNRLCSCETEDANEIINNYIRIIDCSSNKLSTLKFLQNNCSLEVINMTDNDVCDLIEIFYLRDHIHLKMLDLRQNKISKINYFSKTCIRTIRNLTLLNFAPITTEMKVEAFTKANTNPVLSSSVNMQLLMLKSLNKLFIGPNLHRIDQLRSKVLMVVGPPASKKKRFIYNLVDQNRDLLVLGVGHTTRPQGINDVDGRDYYFVEHDEFAEAVRKGEFVTVSEFNGHLYGISYSELEKTHALMIVFTGDIVSALTMKMTGVHLTIMLALPRLEDVHLQWLKEYYIFQERNSFDVSETLIEHCPVNMGCLRKKPSSFDTSINPREECLMDGSLTYKSDLSSTDSLNDKGKMKSDALSEDARRDIKNKSPKRSNTLENDFSYQHLSKEENKQVSFNGNRDVEKFLNEDIRTTKRKSSSLDKQFYFDYDSILKEYKSKNEDTKHDQNIPNNNEQTIKYSHTLQGSVELNAVIDIEEMESNAPLNKPNFLEKEKVNDKTVFQNNVNNSYQRSLTSEERSNSNKVLTWDSQIKQQINGEDDDQKRIVDKVFGATLASIKLTDCSCLTNDRTPCTCKKIRAQNSWKDEQTTEKNINESSDIVSDNSDRFKKEEVYDSEDIGQNSCSVEDNVDDGKIGTNNNNIKIHIHPNGNQLAIANNDFTIPDTPIKLTTNIYENDNHILEQQNLTQSMKNSLQSNNTESDKTEQKVDKFCIKFGDKKISERNTDDTNSFLEEHGRCSILSGGSTSKEKKLSSTNDEENEISKFISSRFNTKARTSISNNELVKLIEAHFFQHPVLSALSRESLNEPDENTKYNTVAERVDKLFDEKMQPFFKSVMQIREDLLNLHWENPGLFYAVIFTDDEKKSLSFLKNVVKSMLKLYDDILVNDEDTLKEDIKFTELVQGRIRKFKINDFDVCNDESEYIS